MRKQLSILWAFSLLLLYLGILSCNRPESESESELIVSTGNLRILFTDESGIVLQRVMVGVDRRNLSIQNGSDGYCLLERLLAGDIDLYIHCDGFVDVYLRFHVEPDKTTEYTVVLKKEPTYIRLHDAESSVFKTKETKGRHSVRLESNWDWWVEDEPGEMTIETRNGKGDVYLHYSWDFPENLFVGDTLMRSFRVLSPDDTLTLKLVLHVPIRVESAEAIDSNGVSGEGGVILNLRFNRQVKNVRQMHKAGWEVRKARPSDNEMRNYSFNLGRWEECRGGSVLVEAESLNLDGVSSLDTVSFQLCDGIGAVEGILVDSWISADENWMWVSTIFPDRVYKVDLHTLNVLKQFDLPFSPSSIAYNYYNGFLYVINRADQQIFVLDAETGREKKIIRVRDKPHRDPSREPCQILFADNGFGLLLTKDENNSLRYWRVIDSRKRDEVSFPDSEQMAGVDPSTYVFGDKDWQISRVELDYTRNRFLGFPVSHSQTIHCFDALEESYSTFQLPVTLEAGEVCMRFTELNSFRVCRSRNQVLVGTSGGLSILNLDDHSFTTPFETGPWGVIGDICGGQSAGDCRSFVLDNKTLLLVDNAKAETLFKSSVMFQNVLYLLAFSAGDRILVIKQDAGLRERTEFFVFNTNRYNL